MLLSPGPPVRAVLPGGGTPPHAGCRRAAAAHHIPMPPAAWCDRCRKHQPHADRLRLMPVPWLINLGVRGRAPRRNPGFLPTNSAEDPSSRTCLPRHPERNSSGLRSVAGGSSTPTRNSKTNSASTTSRGVPGAAGIIMSRSRCSRTSSSWNCERGSEKRGSRPELAQRAPAPSIASAVLLTSLPHLQSTDRRRTRAGGFQLS